ncbi:MAG: Gfo/Idh/MocA family oxidoreductase [Candidatus Omnitrophica bacterium]|nr:Gfo/Idh/MocA family oxidoreductase [Candidatus Omnitrophota bacterium]
MAKNQFRWGILGTAHIARKNWKAIRNTNNGIVTAVASRNLDNSQRFIAECQADAGFATPPRALGSYEELVASSDVDALYIPLPTCPRKDWVLRAAAAGKHVVCEKPCAASLSDLKEILNACERHQVQFMDGVMFMHSRRLDLIRQALDDGRTIGRIKRIDSIFNFNAPDEFFHSNIRVDTGLEPFGCLGDLGWYSLRFALWAMRWQLPQQVTGRILSQSKNQVSPSPAITEFSGELFFADGASFNFYCSFVTGLEQWVNISGTLGSLRVPDFVLPFFGCEAAFESSSPVHNVQGCDFNLEPNTRRWAVPEYSNSHSNSQESNLFRRFAELAQSGNLDRSWPEMALKTQQVMEACRDSALAAGARISLK